MTPIKILLVDDHAVMRKGLASLLGTRKELQVVGDADDGASGIRMALKLKPDVVIMDLMMPEMDGVETTRQLLARMPEAKVLILTSFGSADGIAHALASGAKGALMKTADLAELLDAIRAVSRGERSVSPEIEQILTDDPGLMARDAAASAHFPGGHIEGWPDAFKNMMLKFYEAVRAGKMPAAGTAPFATFEDGANVMFIIDAIVKSHQQQRWVRVVS